MTNDTVRPALTPAEWELLACEERNERVSLGMGHDLAMMLVLAHRTETSATMVRTHQLRQTAALALHGQSFGFTWEDVRLLRRKAENDRVSDSGSDSDLLDDLADRIAALLPPETL